MTNSSLILRPATSADAADLERLAALDSARPLAGDVMLAHADGEVRAAVSLESGRSVADPFYPSLAARPAAARRRRRLPPPPHVAPRRPRSASRARVGVPNGTPLDT